MIDPYSVLGISRDAYKRDIQARYETLKNIWDPAKQPDPQLRKHAEEELSRIEEAYAILMDPRSRVGAHYENDEPDPSPVTYPDPAIGGPARSQPPQPSQPMAHSLPQGTLIKERVIEPSFQQRIWWLFLIVALVFGFLYYNMYTTMLQVAADRDARIGKINMYIDKTNALNDQIAAQQSEIDTLNTEYTDLTTSYRKKNADLTSMTTKYTTLEGKVFCDQTRDKSLAINKSLVQFVNSYRNVTNSYATDEQLFQNNVYSMSRFRVWYSGGYVEQFFYYSDVLVSSNNLPANVFWATLGCWIK